MSDIRVGLVGATGLVGSMMRTILSERGFPVGEFRAFASARSAGREIDFNGASIIIEDAATASFAGLDMVLLSAGGTVSKVLAPKIAADGAIAIDNSSAWRMDPDVPLVVPEVNAHALTNRPKGIIANPNCTTMVAMPVMKPLHDAATLTSMIAATYQAVSGAGVQGVRELEHQISQINNHGDELAAGTFEAPESRLFPSTIAGNVLSIAGNLVDDETDEEHKFRNESRKILEIDTLDVVCTCVRVPVFTGHSIALTAEFARPITPEQAQELLRHAPGVKLAQMPTPLDAVGGDVSLVGRFRQVPETPNRLSLFLSGDNLRKGAALNAVQIAEALIK